MMLGTFARYQTSQIHQSWTWEKESLCIMGDPLAPTHFVQLILLWRYRGVTQHQFWVHAANLVVYRGLIILFY